MNNQKITYTIKEPMIHQKVCIGECKKYFNADNSDHAQMNQTFLEEDDNMYHDEFEVIGFI